MISPVELRKKINEDIEAAEAARAVQVNNLERHVETVLREAQFSGGPLAYHVTLNQSVSREVYVAFRSNCENSGWFLRLMNANDDEAWSFEIRDFDHALPLAGPGEN